MAEIQWYYARNDRQFGPVSAIELKQLADAGQLSPSDLLWRDGMDAWTTAVNLRGLFADEPPTSRGLASGASARKELPARPERPLADLLPRRGRADSLRAVLRSMQITLWTLCVLVVLTGLILFTRAFLRAENPGQEAAAGAIFATFFIAAYVLARAGEKLSRLLLAISRRRSR